MTRLTKYASMAAAVMSLLINLPSGVLAQTDHEQHHPQGAPAEGPQAEAAPSDKTPDASGASKGGMMGMMDSCPMMGRGDGETRVKGRVAFLKAELAITDAQMVVWEAYAAALKKNLASMHDMRQSMMKMMETKSLVERLDQHITAMESRIATLKEVKPALSNLYAALSDDQKKAADQLLTGMGCMM